jgi:hypothetical protein
VNIRANSWIEKNNSWIEKTKESRDSSTLSVVVLVLLVDVVISSVLSCSLVGVSRVSFA